MDFVPGRNTPVPHTTNDDGGLKAFEGDLGQLEAAKTLGVEGCEVWGLGLRGFWVRA